MKQSWAGTIARTSLSSLLLATAGCDALTVNSFAGTTMQFTLANAGVTAANTHLELWARTANGDIVRISPYYQENKGLTQPGFIIKPAITVDDPCIIDNEGHLLTSDEAYPSAVTKAGITQTPKQQAQSIINRIAQLNPPGQPPLLAVLPFSTVSDPVIAADATPAERLAACVGTTANPGAEMLDVNYYAANPSQVTAPLHGAVYGFIHFQTLNPPANYDGFRLDVPENLKDVQELYFTTESVDIAQVDPKNTGPLYVDSKLVPGGRDILQFNLQSPINGGPTGAVAVENTLDEDPVQF
jgi:hypothetical protein